MLLVVVPRMPVEEAGAVRKPDEAVRQASRVSASPLLASSRRVRAYRSERLGRWGSRFRRAEDGHRGRRKKLIRVEAFGEGIELGLHENAPDVGDGSVEAFGLDPMLGA